MVIKKLEELTPEEVDALSKEDYDRLVQDGQLEFADVPAAGKEPEKIPPGPEGDKEPGKTPEGPGKEPEREPGESLADFKKRLEELERANAGLREELIRERHRRKEAQAQPEEQSELVKKILSLEDGDVLDATTVKEGILADKKREAELKRLQEERIRQVEESKELAMARYADYEQTIRDGLPAYLTSLPEERKNRILQMIAESPDPAELAYTYGVRGMPLVKKEDKNKEPEKRPDGKEPPVILRGGKANSTSPADKSIEELVFGSYTAEQLEKMARDAEKERYKGG